MRKNYLSALLLGALLVTSTGTFTSCKDYDDEINDLQEQVDKLATKEDMEAKLSQMQTAIDAAKKTAEDALAKAESAGDTEEINSLKSRIEALEKAAIDVDALKKEIQTAVDEQLSSFRSEIDNLLKDMEEKLGITIADMVTSVELVFSDFSTSPDNSWENLNLSFSTAVEQENVFGKDLTNTITFVKGNQIQTGDKFIVKVSPANAVLQPEMISFVNSKGENLDDFVKVTNVKKYDGLLTSRSSNNTGLWEVSVELNKYDEKGFEAVTKSDVNGDEGYVMFAVRVNNTLSTASEREVVSNYSLYMNWSEYESANSLNYFVNNININKIQNRYGVAGGSKEYVWTGSAAVKPITEGSGINVKEGDNRNSNSYEIVPVVQGKEVTISLTNNNDKVEAPENIRAMYVVLDKENAVESAPSEINAWNSYTYTGLNTVVEGTSTKISINSDKAINDIIGFRVYAVNYDGTLVDPDGKAFYVKVGDEAATWTAAETTIIPDAKTSTNPSDEQSEKVALSLSKITSPSKATFTTDKIADNDKVFDAYFIDENGTVIYKTSDLNTFPADFSKVAKVYTVPTIDDWTKYDDDKTYTGKLEIKNADGFVLATLNVSMTKKLPTTLPSGFTFKDKQVIDGIYNCYMIADNWTANQATEGSMPIENFINFGNGEKEQYNVTFADSKNENNKLTSETVKGSESIVVAKSFIDSKTEHNTVVEYNYGMISSKKNAEGKYEDYKIEAATIKTIYNCFYNDAVHSWAWATGKELGLTPDKNGNYTLPYSTTLTYGEVSAKAPTAEHIWGHNTIDGEFTASLAKPYGGSLVIESATLTSDATGKEDYFTVDNNLKFTAIKTDLGSNPKADVPSTLTIKCKDSYGHERVIKLKMTVTPRK